MNGWTNYETWQIWTESQNDELSYRILQDYRKGAESAEALTEKLKWHFRAGPNSLVNWEEIASALMEA